MTQRKKIEDIIVKTKLMEGANILVDHMFEQMTQHIVHMPSTRAAIRKHLEDFLEENSLLDFYMLHLFEMYETIYTPEQVDYLHAHITNPLYATMPNRNSKEHKKWHIDTFLQPHLTDWQKRVNMDNFEKEQIADREAWENNFPPRK